MTLTRKARNTSNELGIGQLISSQQQRDAIHIAIAPVISHEKLHPGDHIGFVDATHNRVSANVREYIGIVDPFLKRYVLEDEQFWMFLYPQTVTSIRHEWTHPSFTQTSEKKLFTDAQSNAEQWLRAFALMYQADYDEMVHAAITGTEYCFGTDEGPERARSYEFWHHIEELSGRWFTDEHRENVPFRCSC